jgi:hypothetical protein
MRSGDEGLEGGLQRICECCLAGSILHYTSVTELVFRDMTRVVEKERELTCQLWL